MKMLVEIELGSAAMQSGRDVAAALGKMQHRIEDNLTPLVLGTGGVIADENGNTCGRWEVVPS